MVEVTNSESLSGISRWKEKLEARRQRSLYRLIYRDTDNEQSEYLISFKDPSSLLHGEINTYRRNFGHDCRWYPEYPSVADFGENDSSSFSSIVLQTIFDPEKFDLYKSTEGPVRFSQRGGSQVKAVVHVKRMSKKERGVARKKLLGQSKLEK